MDEYDELFPEEEYDEEELEKEIEEEEEEQETGYREGVYFDPETQDFVRDGQHRLKSATGIESWEQWCRNCLMTERGAYSSYGDTFGISTYEVFTAETREKAESILTREITESLQSDPYGRTKYVSDLEFEWHDSDALTISVTIVGIDDVTIDITVVLDARMR